MRHYYYMLDTIKTELIKTDLLDWKLLEIDKEVAASLENYGQLGPLWCIKINNEYQLIDGFKRLTIFKEKNIPKIKILTLPSTKDIHDIIRSIHYKSIIKSAIVKARWLQSVKEHVSIKNITALKIPYYSHLYTDIKRILSLSYTSQLFCHSKQYTFKELLHLIHYNIPLLQSFILDDNAFMYSKQGFYKIVSQSYDLLKRHQWSNEELLKNIEYNTIKTSQRTPQQRTKELLKNLTHLISPIHQKINQSIIKNTSKVKEETNINIQYDTSLESPGINISKHIHSIEDLTTFQEQLTKKQTQVHIQTILKSL